MKIPIYLGNPSLSSVAIGSSVSLDISSGFVLLLEAEPDRCLSCFGKNFVATSFDARDSVFDSKRDAVDIFSRVGMTEEWADFGVEEADELLLAGE